MEPENDKLPQGVCRFFTLYVLPTICYTCPEGVSNRYLEGHLMNKKERRISILCLIFSIFLFLCTVINFANKQIGAAIGGFGSGIFYLSFSFVAYEKSQKGEETKQ